MTAVHLNSCGGGYEKKLPILGADERTIPRWSLTAPGPNGTVEDVEELCIGVLAETIRRFETNFGYIDKRESLGFLIGQVHILREKYDPAKRHGSGSFSGYLYDRLRKRLIDHWRAWYGRNGEKQQQSLDGLLQAARESELAGAHGRVEGHDPTDWAAACGGLLADADSGPDGLVGDGGGEADRRAESRARVARRLRDLGKQGPPAFLDCRQCGERSYRQAPNGRPGWHFPARCGCGAPLLELVAAADGARAPGGLEQGREKVA